MTGWPAELPNAAHNEAARYLARLSTTAKRSRAEAAIGHYKQVIGDGLRLREDGQHRTEVGVRVLNRRPWTPDLRPHSNGVWVAAMRGYGTWLMTSQKTHYGVQIAGYPRINNVVIDKQNP
jgi:hypothetical protein